MRALRRRFSRDRSPLRSDMRCLSGAAYILVAHLKLFSILLRVRIGTFVLMQLHYAIPPCSGPGSERHISNNGHLSRATRSWDAILRSGFVAGDNRARLWRGGKILARKLPAAYAAGPGNDLGRRCSRSCLGIPFLRQFATTMGTDHLGHSTGQKKAGACRSGRGVKLRRLNAGEPCTSVRRAPPFWMTRRNASPFASHSQSSLRVRCRAG